MSIEEIMRRAPSRVSKLCLLNTTARSDSKEKRARRQEMMLRAKEGHFHEIVEELTASLVFNSHVIKNTKKI